MTEVAPILLLILYKAHCADYSKKHGKSLSSFLWFYQNICLWFSESKTLIHLISCLSLIFFLFFILELLRTDHFTFDVTLQPWEYNRLLSHYKPSNFSIRCDCYMCTDRAELCDHLLATYCALATQFHIVFNQRCRTNLGFFTDKILSYVLKLCMCGHM